MNDLKITILAENYAYKTPLSEWGFSALIEFENKKYLFDVGYSGTCTLKNSKHLGLSLKHIDGIILSHGHYDHTDGLELVLKECGPTTIYAHPELFRDRYSKKDGNLRYTGMKCSRESLIKDYGASFITNKKLHRIDHNIYMSGEIPFSNNIEKISSHFKVKIDKKIVNDDFPDDNSLIIDSPKGLIIIFGCAHRGIVNIMEYAKKKFNKNIYAIIGGTHLHSASTEHFDYVVDYIKKENIDIIAPSHCTGIDRIFDLKNIFNKNLDPAFCGKCFILN